jgi:ribosomal protein S18 acetylase RimI-like enzyme
MITIALQEKRIDIRPITQADQPAILSVYQQCEDFLARGPVPTASLDMVLKDIELSHQEGGIFCGICSAEGDMLGIVDYVPAGFEGDPHVAFLSLLMIAAPFRHQGLGQAVVAAIEAEIRQNEEVTTILSGVQVNNPDAIHFWQKRGYRIVTGPTLMPDQTTAFGLRKDLPA